MRLLIIILFLSMSITNCNAQIPSETIQNSIVELYVFKNELSKDERKKVLNNFESLVMIQDLKNKKSFFSSDKLGLYIVTLSITHRSSLLLIYDREKNEVFYIDNNFQDAFKKMTEYIINNDKIDKRDTIQYFESFFQLVKNNNDLRKINSLPSLDIKNRN